MALALQITPTFFLASFNNFRSDRRYMRLGGQFVLPLGQTLDIHLEPTFTSTPVSRYSVGGYVVADLAIHGTGPSGDVPVNAGSFNAPTTQVTT